jgi:multidrug efflux pump subunit AcrA (membrane-fusion protein)
MTTYQKSKPSSRTSIWRSVLVILMAILIGGGGYIFLRGTSQRPTSTPNINSLQTAKATIGNLVLFASGSGTIIPVAESNLGFNASGQVSNIAVKVGDHVEEGQVLAQLDDTYAKINLAKAQDAMNKLTSAAAVATAKQSLADAQTSFVTAKKTLEYLISPEVLYWEEKVMDHEQIRTDAKAANQTDTSDAAKQKVTEAETSLNYAQNSLTYFQKVYEYDYISATFTQFNTVRTRRGTRTAVVKVVDENTGKLVDLIYPPTKGEIGMARSAYDLAKASIAEAQTYLDLLKGGGIPDGATGSNLVTYIQTKHALETAQYNLNATKLVAPFAGTISALDINIGDARTRGSSAITISNIDQPYAIDAYLDERDWGQIKVGYEVDASFDIVPDQVFKGIVTGVYPTLDTTSSNSALLHFTVRLNDPIPYDLPAGSSTSVQVIGGNAENAVLAPIEALHEFGDGKYALFVMTNGKLQLRVVEVGVMNLTKAEIISGLNAGDIVTTGVVRTK